MKQQVLYLLIFVFVCIAYGDDVAEIYVQYFPKKIMIHSWRINAEKEKVKMFSELNPEITSVYIEHLRLKLTNKITNRDSNYLDLFLYKFNEAKHNKSRWSNNYIKHIISSNIPLLKRDQLLSFFKKTSVFDYKEGKVNQETPITSKVFNQNRIDFFEYLYYSQKSDVIYKETTDYRKLVNKEKDKIISILNRKFKVMEVISSTERRELANYAAQYSFLFKDTYLNEQRVADCTFYDFVSKSLTPDYKVNSSLTIGINVNIKPFKFTHTADVENPYGKDLSTDFSVKSIVSLKAGYKMKIKEEFAHLAFLNIKTGFDLYENFSAPQENSIGSISLIDGYFYVYGEFMLNDLRLTSLYSISVQTTVPLYFLNKNFYIGAGLNYVYHYVALKYDFHFEGVAIDYSNNSTPDFFQDRTMTTKKTNHLINPVVVINYNIYKIFDLRLDYLLLDNFQIGLNYNFL